VYAYTAILVFFGGGENKIKISFDTIHVFSEGE